MRSIAPIVIASAVAVAGCGGTSATSPAAPFPTVTNLRGTLPADLYGYMFLGRSYQFSAIETLSDGTARVAAATWSSSDPAVVTIDNRGLAQAVWAGSVAITASSGGQTWTYNAMARPDFSGRWTGTFTVTTCTADRPKTGALPLCSEPLFPTGSVKSITLDLGAVDSSGINTGTLTLGPFADTVFKVRPLLATTTMMDVNLIDSRLTSSGIEGWALYRLAWSVRLDTKWDLQGDFQIHAVAVVGGSMDDGYVIGRINHLTRQ